VRMRSNSIPGLFKHQSEISLIKQYLYYLSNSKNNL